MKCKTNWRATEEGSKVINCDWVNYLTVSLSHYVYIISNTFVTYEHFSKLIRESALLIISFEFIDQVTINFKVLE